LVTKLETLIVGAGVVGCGLAYALRHHADSVAWVEAASQPGTGMTSRNSGVIHAGIYYPEHSLKTRLCREGAALLYRFAGDHRVPHRRTGKYLVANNAEQSAFLDELLEKNPGVPLEEAAQVPAGIRAGRALYSPDSGLVDQHRLVAALIEASGVEPVYNQRVSAMTCAGDRVHVVIGNETYSAARVFNCTGLNACDFVAGRKHHLALGRYFQIQPAPGSDVPDLVYPAVPKNSPSLGIHLTRNLYGETFLGPDLTWIERESYAVNPQAGDGFFKAAKPYLPWLERSMLQPGYAGIRAKLSAGRFSDFELLQQGENHQLCHFLGIESPGLTASLALGCYAARQAGLAD